MSFIVTAGYELFIHKNLTTAKRNSFQWTQDIGEAYKFLDEQHAENVRMIHIQLQNAKPDKIDVVWIDDEEEEDPF